MRGTAGASPPRRIAEDLIEMTLHWVHVAVSWALTLAVFGALALGAAMRHRAAERRLAQLESRKR